MEAQIIGGPETIDLQNIISTYYSNTKSKKKNVFFDLSSEYGLRSLKLDKEFFFVTDIRLPFYLNCREWLDQIQQNSIYLKLKLLFTNQIIKQNSPSQNMILIVDNVCFRDIQAQITTINTTLTGVAELSVSFDNITKRGKYTSITIEIIDKTKIKLIRETITTVLSEHQIQISENKFNIDDNDIASILYVSLTKMILVINNYYKIQRQTNINLSRQLSYHFYLNQLAINNAKTILETKTEDITIPDYYRDINENVSELMSNIRKDNKNNPDLLSEALSHDLSQFVNGFKINQMVYHNGKKGVITQIDKDIYEVRYLYTKEIIQTTKEEIKPILGIQNELNEVYKNINQDVFFPVKNLNEFNLTDIYQKLQKLFPNQNLSCFKFLLQLSVNKGFYLQLDDKINFSNITQKDIDFRPYIITYKIKKDTTFIFNDNFIINRCQTLIENPKYILPYHSKCRQLTSETPENGILINFSNITADKLTSYINNNDEIIIDIKLQLNNDIIIISNSNLQLGKELYEHVTGEYKLFQSWRYILQNEYTCNLKLDGMIWSSINNYLQNIFHKLNLQADSKVKDCVSISNYFITMGLDISNLTIFNNLTIYNLFLLRALSCKFNNKHFKTVLLNTHNAQLVSKQIDNQYQISNSLMYIRYFLNNKIPLLYNSEIEISNYEMSHFHKLVKEGIKNITLILSEIPDIEKIKTKEYLIFTQQLDSKSQVLFNNICEELLQDIDFKEELKLLLLQNTQDSIIDTEKQIIPPIITKTLSDTVNNNKFLLQILLKKRGQILYDSPSDGDCLFYSILQQLLYHNYYNTIVNLNSNFNYKLSKNKVNTMTHQGESYTINANVLQESMINLRQELSLLLTNNKDSFIKANNNSSVESSPTNNQDIMIEKIVYYNYLDHFPTQDEDEKKTTEYFQEYVKLLALSAVDDNLESGQKTGIWGDDLIMRLLSAILNINISVYQYLNKSDSINILEFKAIDNRKIFSVLPEWATKLQFLGNIDIAYINNIHYTSILNTSNCLIYYTNDDLKMKQFTDKNNILVGNKFNIETGRFNYLSLYTSSNILPNDIEIIYYTNKESSEVIYYGNKLGRLQEQIIIWD